MLGSFPGLKLNCSIFVECCKGQGSAHRRYRIIRSSTQGRANTYLMQYAEKLPYLSLTIEGRTWVRIRTVFRAVESTDHLKRTHGCTQAPKARSFGTDCHAKEWKRVERGEQDETPQPVEFEDFWVPYILIQSYW